MGRLQGRWLCKNVDVVTWKRLSENMIAYEVHVEFGVKKRSTHLKLARRILHFPTPPAEAGAPL
jgi:hypothetical protein